MLAWLRSWLSDMVIGASGTLHSCNWVDVGKQASQKAQPPLLSKAGALEYAWYWWAHCTLLVLIDFCPVKSEFLIVVLLTKTFDILQEIIMEYQI